MLRKTDVSGSLVRATAIVTAAGVGSLAAFSFSRTTGWIAQWTATPAGSAALVAGVALTCWRPTRFGWGWSGTGRHWRLVLAVLAAVVAVVGLYRLAGYGTPYEPSVAEIVIVPVGEELLFRGFLLVTLTALLARWMPVNAASTWAVLVTAISFGAGHLGNLGYVPTGFVLFQALIAVAFGLLAGWVRARTNSLAGPIILHAAMNLMAVA